MNTAKAVATESSEDTTGFCLSLANCTIVYSSKRQPCIALSSTEAEIIAASACGCEIVYVRQLLEEVGLPQELPTILEVDNSGAIELARDRKSCHRSRHVARRFFKVRELEALGTLKVCHVPTEDNHADILTKTLPYNTFTRHRCALMDVNRFDALAGFAPPNVEALYFIARAGQSWSPVHQSGGYLSQRGGC